MKFWPLLLACGLTGIALGNAEFIPIQEKAQGQSLTGANLLNDSLYSNPAASAFSQVYAIEATYLMPRSFAVSILDTRTASIGGGLGYFRDKLENFEEPVQGLKLALGGQVTGPLAFGLGGKIVWGPNEAGDHRNLKDLDAGMLTNLDFLQLGLTARNLFGGDATLKQEREWALGGRINYSQILFLSVTAISRWGYLKPYQYGIGAEYVSPWYLSAKGGYRIQPETQLSFWSVGLSFISPKLSLHYALEIPNQAPESREHVLSLTLML